MWQAYILAFGFSWTGREEWETKKYLTAFCFQELEGEKKMSIIYIVVTRKKKMHSSDDALPGSVKELKPLKHTD